MDPRQAWLLLFLGANQDPTPLDLVRIAKGLFLVSRTEGHPTQAHYRFEPWAHGPVETRLHRDLDVLQLDGLVRVHRIPDTRPRRYDLTDAGWARFAELEAATPASDLAPVRAAKHRVTSLGLRELLDQIAAEYPEFAEDTPALVSVPAD